jgi:rod shape-determining protein MreC
MALSRRTSRTGRSRFTLLLVVLTSITVLTLDFRGSGAVDDVRGVASTVFGPVRDAAAWVTSPVSDAWNGVFGHDELADENERLRERIARLEGEVVENQAAAQQLEAIAETEGLALTADLGSTLARVVGRGLTNFENTIELDRGSDDGIALGMPVVTGAGLVGRITQVTGDRSVVQVVTDPGFDLGVRLVTSGDVGIGHGTGEGQPLLVDAGIDLRTVVETGETVMTSGVDRSIFPPDIPVGTVESVSTAADHLTQVLRVELLADLDNLAYVRVLHWTPPPAIGAGG